MTIKNKLNLPQGFVKAVSTENSKIGGFMNQEKASQRIQKRELRKEFREKRLEYEKKRRTEKISKKEKEALIIAGIPKVLKDDKKKPKKPNKKLDVKEFLAKCSFIMYTPYDKRDSIPPDWKPASFNYKRQHLEFLKRFVYPHPLPEILVWASHMWECREYDENHYVRHPEFRTIRLAKKWLKDIICGGSFYKRNTKFFTKAESHWFLTSKLPYNDVESVYKLYFYVKCRARAMNHRLSMMVSDIFSAKFIFGYRETLFKRDFKEKLLEGFLDLLARTPVNLLERSVVGDICDFVLNEVFQYEEKTFSFSGRTFSSLLKLTHEWHDQLPEGITENDLMMERHRIKDVPTLNTTWNGLGAEQFQTEADQFIWTVRELRTSKELRSEGIKMNNCLASYAYHCKCGRSAVFSVERINQLNQNKKSMANLEMRIDNRTLIQAKGSRNSVLPMNVMKVVSNWASQNRIKISLTV